MPFKKKNEKKTAPPEPEERPSKQKRERQTKTDGQEAPEPSATTGFTGFGHGGIETAEANINVTVKEFIAWLTVEMAGVKLVLQKIKVESILEEFHWKNRSYQVDLGAIDHIEDGMPVVMYDVNNAVPLRIARGASAFKSSAAFNRLFKKNLIAQALAAIDQAKQGIPWVAAMVMGVLLGWLLATFIEPYLGIQVAQTAVNHTTQTIVTTNSVGQITTITTVR